MSVHNLAQETALLIMLLAVPANVQALRVVLKEIVILQAQAVPDREEVSFAATLYVMIIHTAKNMVDMKIAAV